MKMNKLIFLISVALHILEIYFAFNVENTGISGIVLERRFKLKKELDLKILNRITIAVKAL